MFPLDLAPGTTIESLVTDVIPAVHARLAGSEGPDDTFTVALRIAGCGSWTIRIRGREMRVDAGEAPRPTLWVYTTEATARHFLQDAIGPKRLLPKIQLRTPQVGAVLTMSDPRVLKRVAMANGRLELAILDDDGRRLAIVFGFGHAARRPIDPEKPDTIAETLIATAERVLRGERSPQDALSNGEVTVRGSRLLAMQLALAIAPFYPTTT
ncbi:MAG: hypothetical protein M3O46_22000 [Myxococcota bacterium]|nr:hypothetical protein [Myxococcota bacterium]